MKKITLYLIPIFLLSCAVNHNEVDGPVYCQINQTETYNLGTDPGVDFNETNLNRNTVFNETDCPQVNNDPFSGFVSRVKREGSRLQIYENQYQPSQILLQFDLNGTEVLPLRHVTKISNCSILREWSGTLDTPGTTITINETATFKGGCESSFYDPDSDGDTYQ